jgi:hypothetical protein
LAAVTVAAGRMAAEMRTGFRLPRPASMSAASSADVGVWSFSWP